MSVLVVDASVVVKWFFAEPDSEMARSLLSGREVLCAPDLLFAEAAQVIWKRVRRGEITAASGEKVALELARIDVRTSTCRDLASGAYALARQLRHSVYDCMYLALALRVGAPLITADQRLAAATAGDAGLRGRLVLLRDYAY